MAQTPGYKASTGQNFVTDPSTENKKCFDPYAHAYTVIQEEHRLIHDGMMFQDSGTIAALPSDANAEFLLKVPAGSFLHVRGINLSSDDGPMTLNLYEGVTVSADGTFDALVNMNRASSRTAKSEVWESPTVTDYGTKILEIYLPDTGPSKRVVHGGTIGEEHVLNDDTYYLYQIHNGASGTVAVGYNAIMYEIEYAY